MVSCCFFVVPFASTSIGWSFWCRRFCPILAILHNSIPAASLQVGMCAQSTLAFAVFILAFGDCIVVEDGSDVVDRTLKTLGSDGLLRCIVHGDCLPLLDGTVGLEVNDIANPVKSHCQHFCPQHLQGQKWRSVAIPECVPPTLPLLHETSRCKCSQEAFLPQQSVGVEDSTDLYCRRYVDRRIIPFSRKLREKAYRVPDRRPALLPMATLGYVFVDE